MKIAVVQMPPHPRDTPPFEMALTAAILRRQGHEVAVFDVNNDLYHETFKQRPLWKFPLTGHSVEPQAAIFKTEAESFARHADRLLACRPDAVIFKTENAFFNALNMALIVKQKSPATVLIGSGTNHSDKGQIARWKRDELECPESSFDYHILGEDDIVLPEVLSAIGRGTRGELAERFQMTGRIIDATAGPHLDNLEELPFYDFTDYDFARYGDPQTIRLNASRGCIQHCAFCQDWALGGKYRRMNAERLFEEYRCQHQRHPKILHLQFYDRLLNGDVAVLERFCDLLIAEYGAKALSGGGGPPVIWAGDFIIRPEMSDALIEKMARAQ